MRILTAPYVLLWRHRGLLMQTTRSDIRARFAGSILGLAWLVIYPLLFLGAYAMVFLFILKIRLAMFNPIEYAVLIFCGLIPFLGFAEALGNGVSSVSSNANLIKNTLFPIELIPVKAVLMSQCTQLVGTVMLLIAVALVGKLTWWALLLPAIWLMQLHFMIGLMWFLSSLNVYMRDLQNLVGVIVLILNVVTPIAYTRDLIPENLRTWLAFNPLYYLVISSQDALMMGRFPREGVFWILCLIGMGTFTAGYWFFTRMKMVFADNV